MTIIIILYYLWFDNCTSMQELHHTYMPVLSKQKNNVNYRLL